MITIGWGMYELTRSLGEWDIWILDNVPVQRSRYLLAHWKA